MVSFNFASCAIPVLLQSCAKKDKNWSVCSKIALEEVGVSLP